MVMVCLHKDHWETLKAIALRKKNYLPIVNGWFGSPTFHDLVQFLLVPQSLVVPLLSHCDLEAVLLHNYNNLSIGSIHPSKAFEFIQIYKYQDSFNLCFYAVEQFNFLDWTASFLLEGKSDQNFVVLHLLSLRLHLEMVLLLWSTFYIPVKLERRPAAGSDRDLIFWRWTSLLCTFPFNLNH